MKRSTAKERVLAALRTGPKLTAELMQVGGRNFPARLEELRREGIDHKTERITQSSYRYTLLENHQSAGHSSPAPLELGPFKLCFRCSRAWTEHRAATGCECGAGIHWLIEYASEAERDRAAVKVDPAKVSEELAFLERMRRGGREAA